MKKQKWRGLPTRLAALGLAAALCLGLPPVSALAEGEGEAPGGDSSSEFVGSDNLLDIFTYNKNSFSGGYVSGNDMYLADTSALGSSFSQRLRLHQFGYEQKYGLSES